MFKNVFLTRQTHNTILINDKNIVLFYQLYFNIPIFFNLKNPLPKIYLARGSFAQKTDFIALFPQQSPVFLAFRLYQQGQGWL